MGSHPGPGLFPAAWRTRALHLGGALLLPAAGLVVAVSVLWLTLPDPLPLASRWPETTAYIELRREQARRAGTELDIRWKPVPLASVSEPLQRAVRVAEDAGFYRHGGIDWHEVRASLREWWREEERPRGASTITMQLARNLYLSPERSFWRKLRETLLALRLEARLSKRRILELYLSTVELGPGIFGVEAAAEHYWNVSAATLDRRRAAELAATLPAPLEDNPRTRTRRFRWRTELIRGRAFGPDTIPMAIDTARSSAGTGTGADGTIAPRRALPGAVVRSDGRGRGAGTRVRVGARAESSTTTTAEGRMITGGITTVYVSDMDRALAFYTETLGLELDHRGGPSWAVVRAPDGFCVGLHDAMGGEVGVAGSTTLGFRVEGDLSEVVEELAARGVEFVGEITEDTAVPLAYLEDPDGNQMYLVEARGGGHG